MRFFKLVCWLVVGVLVTGATASAAPSLWSVNALTKVFPETEPAANATAIEVHGAAGEIVSAQAAIRSHVKLEKAVAAVSALAGDDGRIPSSSVHTHWQRFIEITRNSAHVPEDELVAVAPAKIPDPFWEGTRRDIPADFTQPVWIEVDIPLGCPAGDYSGEFEVRWEGGHASLPLRVHVYDFSMPTARHLYVTNWFTFPGIPYRDQMQTGSEEYWDLARKFAQIIGRHRQNVFRTWLSWVEFSYQPQKGFSGDFSRFDRWCETFFDTGCFDRMEIWGAGRRVGGHATDDARIEMADFRVSAPDGVTLTKEQKFKGVLSTLDRHLQEKGWANKAMIHITDEPFQPAVESYREVADAVHEAAPNLKTIEAIEAEGFGDSLDIWVPKLSHLNLWWDNFQREKERGAEMWFYTCCHPQGRYPNRFLDQSLVAVRILHWINYLYDLDGYLHWGLNHFATDQPFTEEALSGPHPLGDHAMMYPGSDGPMGSLRWSAMRDGIQDFEYLWLLTRRLEKLKRQCGDGGWWLDPRQRPVELCRRAAQSFYRYNHDPPVLLETRRTVAREIEALNHKPMLFVQTSPPDGSEIPYGPRLANVYGVTEPGAKISINGRVRGHAAADGTFELHHFVRDDGTVSVTAETSAGTLEAERQFVLTE